MRQLVGQPCMLCRERIAADIFGRFCNLCGCPVHNKCALLLPVVDEAARCTSCGANRYESAESTVGDLRSTGEQPKPPPTPSWWQRFKVGQQVIFCLLLGVAPGIGWVAFGWRVVGSPLGGVAAAVVNYLILRLTFSASVWIFYRLHPSEREEVRLKNSRLLAHPATNYGPPFNHEATVLEFLGNFACAGLTLYMVGTFGTFVGSLIGIAIMWPLTVISKAEQVQGTHAVTCYALYFLAGISLMG